jgi:ABC-type Fe3+-hydroxamate transport system substrate-binding protein
LVMIDSIGDLVGKKSESVALIQEIKKLFFELNIQKSAFNFPISKVVYLIWKDPYMTIGQDTFINDMLLHCGFENAFNNQNRYPVVNKEQIKQSGAAFLFLSSEPYPFKEKHLIELQKELPMMKIIIVDGEMFSWYGSRMLHAVHYFSQLLPKLIS